MDFKDIYTNIKAKISTLIAKVKAFYENNKMLSLIISTLVVLLLLCILILISINKKNKASKNIPEATLELSDPLLIPNGPEIPKDYTASRTPKDKWTTEETEQWFTVPTQNEIDSLSKANDNLINEITGAAP